MNNPSSNPSISDEPHLRKDHFQIDPSESRAGRDLAKSARKSPQRAEEEKVERSVWDEPGLSRELAPREKGGRLTYRQWLLKRRARVSPARSWAITGVLILAAGPWAIVGAIWGSGQTAFSLLAIIVFGPVVEELMKAAAALYVVEKKPFLYRSPVQILLSVFAGALVFAVIENLIYLNFYIPAPSPGLVRWRWTVCVALHAGCSLISAMGLMRVWRDAGRREDRPRISLAFPYFITAVIIHGAYNALAVILHAVRFQF